jgi:predicted Zn-dependent protease
MKIFAFLILFTAGFIGASSQDVAALLKEADRLEAVPNEIAAFNKFKEVLVAQPNNMHALTKCSELCSRIGSREKSSTNRDTYFAAALAYANKAILVDPKSDKANVARAMALGKSSMTKSGKEKIRSAKEIKKHLDVALATNPSNYVAWHILGRWNYELSNVSGVEKAAAKVFFGGVPQGSLKDAIMYFEKARTLSPHFILNNIELAKAYHKNNEDAKAIALLKAVQAFPISTEDDAKHKVDALKLIKEYE